jgi:hypothetical protein
MISWKNRTYFAISIRMIKLRLLLFPVVLGLSCTASAQVYKSTDADGNVIFTDTPAADSEEVEISEPNIADPVEVPAYVPPPEPQPKAVEQQTRQPGEELVGEVWVEDDGRKRLRRLKTTPRSGPANSHK